MQKIRYQKVLVPARLAEDGETASVVWVTQERNCYIVWFCSFEQTTTAVKVFNLTTDYSRDKALDFAMTFKPASIQQASWRSRSATMS